jgi:hypothetical protein
MAACLPGKPVSRLPGKGSSCRYGCAFVRGDQKRFAVGKTHVYFPVRGRQQLAPPLLTSLFACTHALRRGILQRRGAWRQARPLSTRRGRRALVPNRALFPSIQSTLKANAVPIAASSSDFASAGPTASELRRRSSPALRIQDSAKKSAEVAHRSLDRWSRSTVGFSPFAIPRPTPPMSEQQRQDAAVVPPI